MASCMLGMSASAYEPTITKTFAASSTKTATATLYADTSYASAKTTCSGVDCSVKLTYCGITSTYSSKGYAYLYKVGTSSSSSATSVHTANGKSITIKK